MSALESCHRLVLQKILSKLFWLNIKPHWCYNIFSGNQYLKIKAEPKTANCCGSSLQSNLQKVNSTSKYDYGERRYITGNEQTPSSPSGSVCSSTSGKESSSLSPCSKDISPYTIPSESSCTYMNRSGERWDMNYYILYLNRWDKHCVCDVDVFVLRNTVIGLV